MILLKINKEPAFGLFTLRTRCFCFYFLVFPKIKHTKLVLIIHYNNSAYSFLKRFAANFLGNSITLFYNKRLAEIFSVSLLSFESAILKFNVNNSLWKLRF